MKTPNTVQGFFFCDCKSCVYFRLETIHILRVFCRFISQIRCENYEWETKPIHHWECCRESHPDSHHPPGFPRFIHSRFITESVLRSHIRIPIIHRGSPGSYPAGSSLSVFSGVPSGFPSSTGVPQARTQPVHYWECSLESHPDSHDPPGFPRFIHSRFITESVLRSPIRIPISHRGSLARTQPVHHQECSRESHPDSHHPPGFPRFIHSRFITESVLWSPIRIPIIHRGSPGSYTAGSSLRVFSGVPSGFPSSTGVPQARTQPVHHWECSRESYLDSHHPPGFARPVHSWFITESVLGSPIWIPIIHWGSPGPYTASSWLGVFLGVPSKFSSSTAVPWDHTQPVHYREFITLESDLVSHHPPGLLGIIHSQFITDSVLRSPIRIFIIHWGSPCLYTASECSLESHPDSHHLLGFPRPVHSRFITESVLRSPIQIPIIHRGSPGLYPASSSLESHPDSHDPQEFPWLVHSRFITESVF